MDEQSNEEKWILAEDINRTDGLEASDFLKRLILKNNEGLVTTEEIKDALVEHYDDESKRLL